MFGAVNMPSSSRLFPPPLSAAPIDLEGSRKNSMMPNGQSSTTPWVKIRGIPITAIPSETSTAAAMALVHSLQDDGCYPKFANNFWKPTIKINPDGAIFISTIVSRGAPREAPEAAEAPDSADGVVPWKGVGEAAGEDPGPPKQAKIEEPASLAEQFSAGVTTMHQSQALKPQTRAALRGPMPRKRT